MRLVSRQTLGPYFSSFLFWGFQGDSICRFLSSCLLYYLIFCMCACFCVCVMCMCVCVCFCIVVYKECKQDDVLQFKIFYSS